MNSIRTVVTTLLCLVASLSSWTAQPSNEADSAYRDESRVGSASAPPASTALRYDSDYPFIGYSNVPTHNAVARLQSRLNRGEVTLAFHDTRGYLDAVLTALDIDPSSQTLVYSKTSLQIAGIRASTPRAVYFNDETYVAWVQGADLLELATMDSALGPVFYTLANHSKAAPSLQRETLRCLSCHDRFALSGGGVPLFTVLSSLVGTGGQSLTHEVAIEVTDRTPIDRRWGGWYVTGLHPGQTHLGNILIADSKQIKNLDQARQGNLSTLAGLFETRPYLTDKSDIVALLILEHQTYVQNLMTRVNYKARAFVAKESNGSSWNQVSPQTQSRLKKLVEPLIEAMLFVDAAPIAGRISGNSGYDSWFQSQGPRDPAGRSLRELDLTTRLFKYPLSYLIYSDGFEGLPEDAKHYIYSRLSEILVGHDASERYAHLSEADRAALLQILTVTKPAFASVYRTLSDNNGG